MNKPINLKPLSKKHCEWIMFNHFKDYFRDKYSDKKKYPAFDLELVNNMSLEDLNLKIIEVPIEGDNLEGLIKNGSKHKSKDNVVRFIIDYQNPFSKKEHSSLNVLAKTSKPYLPDRKENIRNEKESLKLCNDVYPLGLRKIGKEVDEGLVKFVPQYYAYDNELSVLFREYLDAKNLTKVMLEAQNEWNNEKDRKIKINISRNVKNLMKAAIWSLADFHEEVSNHKDINKFNIKRPDAYSYAYDFSNLTMELSEELGIINNRDVYYKEELINNFLSSPLGKYLNSEEECNKKFILGDFFSDNILVNNTSNICSSFGRKELPPKFWKTQIRIIDLGKCQIGPAQLDLNDLLNEPYPGFRKLKEMEEYSENYTKDRILGNHIASYVNFVNTKKNKIGYRKFREGYNYCSVLRLMRERVNERYGQFKPGFIKRLNDVMGAYPDFYDLKNTLNKRGLLNISKHK